MKPNSKAIIPPNLAIRAMRDSGYKNTAYALAELIDNSVQAKANLVELVCIEETTRVNNKNIRRIKAIGVFDNGEGMNPEKLSDALQFGNGEHLNDRSGIGRFGMGLPNSSISQCKLLQVWTWQAGYENAIYSYLDVDKIESGSMIDVHEPEPKKIPDEYAQLAENISDSMSGTLVLWTGFSENRLKWKQAKTMFDHTEFIIGRMYRKFIENDELVIRMYSIFDGVESPERFVRINDPMYLTEKSTTPVPFDNEAMFQPWDPDQRGEVFPIVYEGKTYDVTVRISYARAETLPDDYSNRGATDYGQHARKNLGVSIVRERRELDLDRGWTISYDPTERWWGVEVEFPSTLDTIFGVTNNKQSATIFSQMADFDWEEEADENEKFTDFKERIHEQGDPRALLFPIADYIQKQLSEIRNLLKAQTHGRRKSREIEKSQGVEERASDKFRGRAKNHPIQSDNEEPTAENQEDIKNDFMENENMSESDAEKIAQAYVAKKLKVGFRSKQLDGYAFFNVGEAHGGITIIEFNTNHLLFDQLISSLDLINSDEEELDLNERIIKASDTLKLLFASWARFEKEEIDNEDEFFNFRQKWGKMATYFLKDENENE